MITEARIKFQVAIGLALLVSICIFPLAYANDNPLVSNNNTVSMSYTTQQTSAPSPTQTLTAEEEAKEKEAAIDPFLRYKENMTFWQKKLPNQILELIDPNAPLSGMTRDEIRIQMIDFEKNMIPAEEVFTKFGISQPTGDLVKVTININSSVSTHIVNPYVVYLIGKRGNLVDAWVDLNNIEKIATLENVKWIDLIFPSVSQGPSSFGSPSTNLSPTYNNSVVQRVRAPQPVLNDDIPVIPSTTLTALPVVPSKTNTPVSSLSLTGIFAALACSGLIVMLYRLKDKKQ